MNVHVIIFGAIYLSMMPEILTLPLAIKGTSPTKATKTVSQNFTISLSKLITTELPSTSIDRMQVKFQQETNSSSLMENIQLHELNATMQNISNSKDNSQQTDMSATVKKVGYSGDEKAQTEVTLKMAKLSKDQFGNWVYNPWVVTFGNRLMDHRFAGSRMPIKAHVNVNSNPKNNYKPAEKLATVCMGTPIPYVEHKVMAWLDRHVYKHKHKNRVFYMDMRREMYARGISEFCHTTRMNGWMKYQNCQLRRNMRIEGFIPHYPLHQRINEIHLEK